jgi:NAD(P)H-flavin reductase
MPNPRKLKATLKTITPHGSGIYRLDFLLEKPFPRYKAGQFLHLAIDPFDPASGFWPESRVFSIASSSEDRTEITIVYSVKGAFTGRMERELQEGTQVWLKGPYGDFIIGNHLKDKSTAVLIAGGTGISPFLTFLREGEGTGKARLYYGIRNPEHLLFPELLSQAREKGAALHLYIEHAEENSPSLPAKKGTLSIETIHRETSSLDNPVYFISGPPGMIDTFRRHLETEGIEKENIIIDEWG